MKGVVESLRRAFCRHYIQQFVTSGNGCACAVTEEIP